MVRRSFRIGLRLGLLTGVVAAVVKTVQARRNGRGGEEPAPPPAWPPVAERAPEPATAAAAPTPDHPQSALVTEPEVPSLQADEATPAPVRKSPGKKAAAKKAPATKKAASAKAAAPAAAAWVEPTGSVCPPSHPVKAKLSSKLFHLPGMFAYARTVPDRCYRSEADAEADGLTKAKR